ncbi:MAG TPA: hypothetical protein VI197_28190, partial [Polyangiaceae bacterium]
MTDVPAELPPPRDDDDDDVAWALQTAQVQWQRGAHMDAVTWLRRAADSALRIGATGRAWDLKLAASKLVDVIPSNSPAPAPLRPSGVPPARSTLPPSSAPFPPSTPPGALPYSGAQSPPPYSRSTPPPSSAPFPPSTPPPSSAPFPPSTPPGALPYPGSLRA